MIAATTGLFLVFVLFTAQLFSMVSFKGGEEEEQGFRQQQVVDSDPPYSLLRQASAQEQSTSSPPTRPSTLPFTPFSLQQQETVPEQEQEQEGEQPTDEEVLEEPPSIQEPPAVTEGTAAPPPAAANDDDQTTLQARPRQDLPLAPQPNEPTTRQGGDQSEGSDTNTTLPLGGRQIETAVREGSLDVSSFSSKLTDVTCESGAVTGGGFNLPTPTIQISESSPPAGRYGGYKEAWNLGAKNTVSGSDSANLYAVCISKIIPENIVNGNTSSGNTSSGSEFFASAVRINGITISPNSWGAVGQPCAEGLTVTGGGFRSYAFTEERDQDGQIKITPKDSDIRVYKSYPSANGWAIEAKSNHQTLPTRLIVYAICAQMMGSSYVSCSNWWCNLYYIPSESQRVESNRRYVPLTIPPNGVNSVVSSCREGEAVLGGGWYSQSSDVYIYKSYPSSNGWIVEAKNWNPTNAGGVTVYAMCARIVPITQQAATPATVPPSPSSPTDNATGTATTMTPATNDTGGGEITELTTPSSSEPPLRVEAIANATQAVAPATIRLDANITGGAPPYSYSWSVPDLGVIDQDRSITQMFFEPGTFTYGLTVTDSRGKVVTDNVQIVISERGLPTEGIVSPEPGGIAPPPLEGGGVSPGVPEGGEGEEPEG